MLQSWCNANNYMVSHISYNFLVDQYQWIIHFPKMHSTMFVFWCQPKPTINHQRVCVWKINSLFLFTFWSQSSCRMWNCQNRSYQRSYEWRWRNLCSWMRHLRSILSSPVLQEWGILLVCGRKTHTRIQHQEQDSELRGHQRSESWTCHLEKVWGTAERGVPDQTVWLDDPECG